MKKILAMGASALALGIGMSAAHAEDPLKLTLSGGAQEAIGYLGNDDNKDNVATSATKATAGTLNKGTSLNKIYEFGDGSITFDAKTKLDSGITVEFNAGLNISGNSDGGSAIGNGGAKTLKTSENDWIAFSGSFGKFEIGDDFNAAMQAHNDAPYYGAIGGLNWGRNQGYIQGPIYVKGNGPSLGDQTVMFDDYEATKVVYTTPSFGGFGVTASYTPAGNSGDTCCGALNSAEKLGGGDTGAAAIFYKGDMGDAKISADVGYVYENLGNNRGIDAGLSVSFKGFTIGGSWLNRAYGGSGGSAAQEITDGVGNTYDIGLGYQTGPWSVSLAYMASSARAAGTQTMAGLALGAGAHLLTGDAKWYEIPATVQYNLGPGVTLNLEVGYENWKTPDGLSADQITGVYGLVGTTVSF